jgi:hypothetical protein
VFVKDDSALAAFLYKSEMFLHNFIIPVSTITRVGCFTFDMETFKVNRDLCNFCSISGCSKDYSALADKLEVFSNRSLSEETRRKRRGTQSWMAISTDELTFATKRSLRNSGNATGSQILDFHSIWC